MKTVKSDFYEAPEGGKWNEPSSRGEVVCPASLAQRRFWFLDRLMPGGRAFNLPAAYRITGMLDVRALEKTISEIVRRHGILRTAFKEVDGGPVQVIADPSPVRLPVIDLRVLDAARREARVRDRINGEFEHVFDLASGPLMTLSLLKTGDSEHVLVKNMHQIITDPRSEEVFIQEWISLYAAFSQNKQAALTPLQVQYADYAEWQKQALGGEAMERQVAYWKDQLGGGIPPLSLPTDHPRAVNPGLAGAAVKFKVPQPVADALRALAGGESVTLFDTCLAAFKILLHRYTGQAEIAVGTPVNNRNRPEYENLIGFFLNTLVLRTEIAGDRGFRENLARVRAVTAGAFEHQDVPFEVLVEKLQPTRDLSEHPLSQVMFEMPKAPEKVWKSGGITVEAMEIGRNSVEQDIVLSLFGREGAIEGLITYSTALFEEETVVRMTRHFQMLLEGIAAAPDRPVAELEILDEAERRQILVEWNDTTAPCTLVPAHELVAAQCARTPAATAIEFEERTVSYAELLDRSRRVAARLQKLGARPGQLIGICVDRSPEMIFSMLGVLMSGCAYVPLDPEFPAGRLQDMIEDAAPPIIITQRAVKSALPGNPARLFYIEDKLPPAGDFHTPSMPPEDIAYVLFTSGSTGRPKGVEIPHRALTNLLESMRTRPGMEASDTLLAVTTLSFDIAGLEIFLPLICGARILLAGTETSRDPRKLVKILGDADVTVMQATPATWRGMLAAGWKGSSKLKILCGGEAMPRDLAEALVPRCSSLWNVYGPTETTIWSTLEKVEAGARAITIGRPIANTRIYILDHNGRPQPLGVHGELCIGGLGVARGYLKRGDLTAEKFVQEPGGKPGERIYKTGDLARWRADGTIEFLGRIDHQVKVRGFRIELAEIESALSAHPSVRQCVVVAREDDPGDDKRLVAYVTCEGRGSDADLRAFLKNRLPDYMIPSAFVFLDALPLTLNGKIDRKALPAPGQARQSEPAKPGTPLERMLAGIWSRVLKLENVGIHDDFFELGGHSLMAVGLFAEIDKQLGKNLPLATLFQAPTISQLAAIIEQEGWTAPWSPLVAIQPHGSREPFFSIHGADGEVLFYSKLAALLGEDQPFYGLQAQGLDGGQVRHSSMESIAALYIKEIRNIQPSGPYFLGGYSFGGILSFEIAQQLSARGETVALLALFDANNPVLPPRRYTLRERIALRLREISGMSPGRKLAYIFDRGIRKATVLGMVFKHRVRRMVYRTFSEHKEVAAPADRLLRVHEAHEQALNNYRPSLYHGKLTLIRAENPNDGFEFDPELGWTGLAADGIEVHDIPGEHETIFHEPNVGILAAAMKDCIEKAHQAQAFK